MTKDDIIIYSTHTCGYCYALMSWLDDNKVEYTVKHIDSEPEAQAELMQKIGGNVQVVPVTFIKDTMIEGFNRNQFAAVLKQNGVEINNL